VREAARLEREEGEEEGEEEEEEEGRAEMRAGRLVRL